MKKTENKSQKHGRAKKIILAVTAVAVAAGAIGGGVALARSRRPVSVAQRPQPVETDNQPFVRNVTGESENFRIPAMVTLESGRIVAAADARYDKTQDGGGLDTIVALSDDSGKTWKSYTANYLGDNGNAFSPRSTAIMDPELLTDGKNVWMLATFYSGGRNIVLRSGMKGASKGSAFNEDGTLKISSNHGLSYNCKVDIENFVLGYSDILKNNGDKTGFKIDECFNLYDEKGESTGNIFYIQGAMKYSVVPTTYLYLTCSTDGGESFGTPKLLNVKKENETFYGVGPGRGVYTKDGTLVFSAYVFNKNAAGQKASFIYSEDGGKTWKRSAGIESDERFEYSGESQLIELSDGTLRCFFRNASEHICYADAVKENGEYSWSTAVVTEVESTSSCMLSAITVENGNESYILVSCPTGVQNGKHTRSNGKIFVFDANSMKLLKTTALPEGEFMYSCLSELKGGRIAMLFENRDGEITFTVFEREELLF